MKTKLKIMGLLAAALIISPTGLALARHHGRHPATVALTPAGQKLEAQYATTLKRLRSRIEQALPSMDPGMTHPFMKAYRDLTAKRPYLSKNTLFTQAVAKCQQLAAPLLSMADDALSSDSLDAELVEASVIADATPRGLAAFAQRSQPNKQLIEQLLSDPVLMKQMQMADGARNGNDGLTMQIYTHILRASRLARKGVLQRLALATALSQKSLLTGQGPNRGVPYDPVKRYLAYQNAYLKGELDPYFPTFSTWQYRYVIDDPRSDAEIAWTRTALQNYLPTTVFDRAYLDVVHTDVGYSHEHLGIVPGNFISQLIAGGGECGARAWVGRISERAFGVPVWGVRQRGHAALSLWEPAGWGNALGAGFDWNWWGNRSGDDFALEAQARRYPQLFIKVLRAKWIAAALGETAPNGRVPGTGGFWYALANCQERAIVASGKPTLVIPTIKQLMVRYGPTLAQKVQMQPIPRSAREVSVDAHGVIHIPAAACSKPRKNVAGVTFSKSFAGGMQVHYYIFKRHPAPLVYIFNAPHRGKYELSARVVALRPEAKVMGTDPKSQLTVHLNHGSKPAALTIPWTDGLWQLTRPVTITLKRGTNVLTFSPGDNFHAVSIKEFNLTPVR